MVATPLPTPHDITAIPIFPYEPGTLLWILVPLIPLLGIVISVLLRSRLTRFESPYAVASRELTALIARSDLTREELTHAARTVKRFITIVAAVDLTNCGPDALCARLSHDPRFESIAETLGSIERRRFGPEISADEVRDLIRSLATVLQRCHESIRVPLERSAP